METLSSAVNEEYLYHVGGALNIDSCWKEKPRLYIVTVNYKSGAHLRRLVQSLSPLDFVEKLVVVNHSPCERLEGLKGDFPIQVVHEPNRGYGAGLNRGLQEVRDARGLVLLCNPDIAVLNHEAIVDVWHYMNDNPSVGVLIPALVDARLRPISSCRKFYSLKSLLLVRIPWFRKRILNVLGDHYYRHYRKQTPLEVDWGSGAAMFIRPFEMNGDRLFDERFFLYFEDVDLCARMWQKNRQVVYFPDLVCQHWENRLSHKQALYLLVHIASLLKFMLKHRGLPQRAALRENRDGRTRLPEPNFVPFGDIV